MLGGSQIFQDFFKNYRFQVYMPLCENRVSSLFFLKIEGSQEPSLVLDFFQGKKVWFSSLVVLSNSRTAEFFGRSSEARFQKLQYSFWKLIFYIIIFLPKMDFEYISVVYKSIIYFKKFIQIVLTPLLNLHLSQ